MLKRFYEKYWDIGYKTSLYDALTPISYRKSFKKVIEKFPQKTPFILLDVGCGSGQFLEYLGRRLEFNDKYLGIDCSMVGLRSANKRVLRRGSVRFILGDFERQLPFKDHIIDITIMHFALYIIPDSETRLRILKNLFSVLKPGGRVITSNPSVDYDSTEIIRDSLQIVLKERGRIAFLFQKFIGYLLTKNLGLRFIEKKLTNNQWKAYSEDEINAELISAGFCNVKSESIYSGSGWVTIGEKKK